MKGCQISCTIWEDEHFLNKTPEFKFFWLYLLTNRHIDICGVIHAADITISKETGFSLEAVRGFKQAFAETTKQIVFDESTNEILVLDWYKNNWTTSPKFIEGLKTAMAGEASSKVLEAVKERIGMFYHVEEKNAPKTLEKAEKAYSCYGTFKRIRLTDEQHAKLISEFGEKYLGEVIDRLDEYIQSNNNKNHYTDFNLVIRKAIRDKWSIIRLIPEEPVKEAEAKEEESFKQF